MVNRSSLRLSNIARRLNLAAGATHLPYLYFMTDPVRTPDPIIIANRLPRGTAIILRHYETANKNSLAKDLQQVCRARSMKLIVAEDIRLANAIRADGLHLPEWALTRPRLGHRYWKGLQNGILTAAVHSARALHVAQKLGVDVVLASPIFPTGSHPNLSATGVLSFAKVSRSATVPVVALGGLDELTAPRLIGTPCAGIAAIGSLID